MAQEYVAPRMWERFGRLRVFWPSGRIKGKKGRAVLCVCDCGGPMVAVMVETLRRGARTSCGCRLREGQVKHGQAKRGRQTVIYRTWQRMVERCHNPHHKSYRFYGAKGRSVWPAWRGDFAAFAAYVERHLGLRPEGLTIDRIDNTRGYEPGNIRWACRSTQRRNR